jgi:hypothetical protein
MTRWRCPKCDREFGRARQPHVCVPGTTVDESFAGRPPGHRLIYDAIAAHVDTLGPVHEDAVGVGVFLKHGRTFAQVRPKARAVTLWLFLPRPLDDARVSRSERVSSDRYGHVIKLSDPGDVDDQLRAWLTEAYDAAGEP